MGRPKGSKNLIKVQRCYVRQLGVNARFRNYSEWLDTRTQEDDQLNTPDIADPDVLGNETDEPVTLTETEETAQRCQLLIKKSAQFLTERQYQVFQLVAVQALGFAAAAKKLSKLLGKPVARQAVEVIWEQARVKLAKIRV